jgi:hypothetical protein
MGGQKKEGETDFDDIVPENFSLIRARQYTTKGEFTEEYDTTRQKLMDLIHRANYSLEPINESEIIDTYRTYRTLVRNIVTFQGNPVYDTQIKRINNEQPETLQTYFDWLRYNPNQLPLLKKEFPKEYVKRQFAQKIKKRRENLKNAKNKRTLSHLLN